MLFLLNTLPAQAGTAHPEVENTTHIHSEAARPEQRTANTKKLLKKRNAFELKEQPKPQLSEFVTLSRLIVNDAFVPQNNTHPGTSAFDPAVVHLILGAQATEWASGHALFTTHGDNKEDRFTSAACTPLSSIKIRPLSLTAGKAYPYFGKYSSTITPYPRSLTIGDLYDPDEIVGFGNNISGTHSDSDSLQKSRSNSTKGSGSPFAYSYRTDGMSLNAGISWINDIADTNGVSKAFELAEHESFTDRRSGFNLNLGAKFRAFSLTGGYIRGLDKYPHTPLSLAGNETEPSAWNGELAYTTALLRKETTLAVGYQKSSEALKVYLPEQRYITRASMALFENTTLSLEYYLDKEHAGEAGGTDENGYGVTTKIGFGF